MGVGHRQAVERAYGLQVKCLNGLKLYRQLNLPVEESKWKQLLEVTLDLGTWLIGGASGRA